MGCVLVRQKVRRHSHIRSGLLAAFALLALVAGWSAIDASPSYAVEPLELEQYGGDIIETPGPGDGDNESGDAEEIIIPNIAGPTGPRGTVTLAEEPGVLETLQKMFLAVTNWFVVR